jgi:hypothetical protein
MVSAAAIIVAVEPSRTPIVPREIFILRLLMFVTEIEIRSEVLGPLFPHRWIGDVAFYSGLFILFLLTAILMLRDLILSVPKCSSSFRSARAPIYSGLVLKYLLSILRTAICWFCKGVNVAALDVAKSALRTRILGRRLTTSRFAGGLLAGRSDEGRIGNIRASPISAHRRHADEQPNGGRCTFIDAESQVEGPGRQCGLHSEIPNRGRGSSVIPSPCDKAAGSCSLRALMFA